MPRVKNRQAYPFTLNLERGVDYGRPELAPSEVVSAVPVALADGKTGVQEIARQLPGSLTWGPGETLEVPETILANHDFKRAVPRILIVVS